MKHGLATGKRCRELLDVTEIGVTPFDRQVVEMT